ncbi:MAG: HD domain-containing protein [Methylococcales bacterium]|jgi:HD-GYP domain-containing protein (c-di-GMP phosphodiesterase class II)|nr:HD domain-containing protein [Methylococcales bacterium]MBT7442897.1 HD domain-containing protein [Methylococcales bacterium]
MITQDTRDAIEDILDAPFTSHSVSQVLQTAKQLQKIITTAPDAAISSITKTQNNHHYAANHSVDTAILAETLAKELDWPPEKRLTLVSAALTMNISMTELQNRLFHHTGNLDADDKAQIESHPTRAMSILHTAGVKNRLWLEAVICHHETIDGKGYPRALKGSQIPVSARILAVADIYTTMISPRSVRNGLSPNKDMFKEFMKRSQLELKLSANFLWKTFVLPAGFLINLNSYDKCMTSGRS